jgi:hypothetical protein
MLRGATGSRPAGSWSVDAPGCSSSE